MRGFALGCQPMKGWVTRRDDASGRYYDVLIYGRKLEDAEVERYELEYVGTLAEYEARCEKALDKAKRMW